MREKISTEEYLEIRRKREYINELALDIPDGRLDELIKYLEELLAKRSINDTNVIKDIKRRNCNMF